MSYRPIVRAAALAALVASCGAPPAFAQQSGPACMPIQNFLDAARDQFNELPVFSGEDAAGAILMVTASATGSFSAARMIGGLACVFASGEGATVKLPQAPKAPEKGS